MCGLAKWRGDYYHSSSRKYGGLKNRRQLPTIAEKTLCKRALDVRRPFRRISLPLPPSQFIGFARIGSHSLSFSTLYVPCISLSLDVRKHLHTRTHTKTLAPLVQRFTISSFPSLPCPCVMSSSPSYEQLILEFLPRNSPPLLQLWAHLPLAKLNTAESIKT